MPLGLTLVGLFSSATGAFAAGGLLTNGGNYTGSVARGRVDQWTFSANKGNVVQTARVLGSGKTIQFTAALGFGSTQAAAVGTAESSLQNGWPVALKS